MLSTPRAIALGVLLGVFLFAGGLNQAVRGAAGADEKQFEAVLVEPPAVIGEKVAAWKKEGFRTVVVILEEPHEEALLQKVAQSIAAHSLDLYFWIEVGRNPALARAHPEWMASLGMHDDWRKRFPRIRPLAKGEVAKAWPWVPITYQEAYDAQLARVKKLLGRLPQGYRGLLLNDLQAGPASCGCGNLQCRWAVDYGVPSTGAKRAGPDAAAQFVTEVGKAANGKEVIPVWVTECAHEDLAPEKQRPPGGWSTGLCGTVNCFDTCRKKFAEQWSALQAVHRGPTGLLLLHRELQRERKEYGGPGGWMTRTMKYLDDQTAKPFPRQRLWLVVQGYDISAEEEAAARRAAAQLQPSVILVARSRIDQSYEPRIVKVKPAPWITCTCTP
jgi:hypothetical protein